MSLNQIHRNGDIDVHKEIRKNHHCFEVTFQRKHKQLTHTK